MDGSAVALDVWSSVFNDAATTMTGCAFRPLVTPIPGSRPRPLPDMGALRDDGVARINPFRWEYQCLSLSTRWNAGEVCADQQAEYDVTHGPHAGIRTMICSPGEVAKTNVRDEEALRMCWTAVCRRCGMKGRGRTFRPMATISRWPISPRPRWFVAFIRR